MKMTSTQPFELYRNPRAGRLLSYNNSEREKILSLSAFNRVQQEITTWTGYHPTPLISLDGIAKAYSLRNVLYKDEGGRFGLGSFKALGGAYAVFRLLQEKVRTQTGAEPSSRDILGGKYKEILQELTVTCATDGNHGRSVAWGARLFGCRAVIYVHATVSDSRVQNIAGYGAEVRRVSGNYDDAVRAAADDAEANGWFVVSDTSYEGYTEIPRDVMQGYAVIVDEALDQLPRNQFPTHVFVQGGVGGLAAGVCSYLWERLGDNRPTFVVVEPDKADCLFRTAKEGNPVVVHGQLDTIMAGLACGEVSLIAWDILKEGADAFMVVTDDAAADAMRLLANAPFEDRPIVAGESAVAGLAGLLHASSDPKARAVLGLTNESIVLIIGTEGATDPSMYKKIVGRSAEEVSASKV